jgi:hypothetical protein
MHAVRGPKPAGSAASSLKAGRANCPVTRTPKQYLGKQSNLLFP